MCTVSKSLCPYATGSPHLHTRKNNRATEEPVLLTVQLPGALLSLGEGLSTVSENETQVRLKVSLIEDLS